MASVTFQRIYKADASALLLAGTIPWQYLKEASSEHSETMQMAAATFQLIYKADA
jgi:hypothetical protein